MGWEDIVFWFKNNKKEVIALIIMLGVVAIIAYFFFFRAKTCYDIGCFQEASADCNRASYVNEDSIATWKYEILGQEDEGCAIKVTLLNAKQGELGMDKLIGYDMTCYTSESVSYPEKNLKSCHGRLKEEILYAIITKLHSYVIDNLEQIGKEMGQV